MEQPPDIPWYPQHKHIPLFMYPRTTKITRTFIMVQPSAMAALLAPSVPGGPSAGLPTTKTEEERQGGGEKKDEEGKERRGRRGGEGEQRKKKRRGC